MCGKNDIAPLEGTRMHLKARVTRTPGVERFGTLDIPI